MKFKLVVAVTCLSIAITVCTAEDQAQKKSVQPIATALEHLTVIEYDEPVVQAAVGSPSFQVERQDNKVFVKPLKAEASTNLFVWTASNHPYCYELVVGDASRMDAEIHIPRSTPAQRSDSQQLDQLADAVATRTLLTMESVDSAGVKMPKGGIGIRIEGILRNKKTLLIRYSLENHSALPYLPPTPSFYQVKLDHPNVSLMSYTGKQLDQRTNDRLGEGKEIPLPSSFDSDVSTEIAPGTSRQGIIAVPNSEAVSSPTVIRLIFAPNVKATMVL